MIATPLPQGLVARAPEWDDADAVAALYNACSMEEQVVPHGTADDMRREWRTPGFDLARDAWLVATADGQVVGYTDLWSSEPYTRLYGDGQVHPAFQGRGIGTHLLRMQEARARQVMAWALANAQVSLVNHALSTNGAARALLENASYTLQRHFWRMALDLDAEPPAPEWPAGIVVRAAIPGQDERAVHAVVEEAFQDHYDHTPVPFETWLHWQTADPDRNDLSLWFLALDSEQIAGAAVCAARTSEDPDCGWLDDLGVRRPWRRRGLGMALLRHSFREFYRRQKPRVGLSVDAASLTGATRLYERAGLHVVRQTDRYAKELRPLSDHNGAAQLDR
jgi:mycothiol synthase